MASDNQTVHRGSTRWGASLLPARAWGRAIPSWAGSIALHVLLLTCVLALWGLAPSRPQPPGERSANVGIVLAREMSDGREVFERPDPAESDREASQETATRAAPSLEEVLRPPDASPPNAEAFLPTTPVIGPSTSATEAGSTASGAAAGPSGQGNLSSHRGKVGFLGVEGEGSRFVYVIDRSASMADYNSAALRLAKTALIQSIESLQPTHQFQIVFFNEKPAVFNPAGQRRLSLATDQNKRIAAQFIATIVPDGGTNHEDALTQAINLRPDVIFFLTDAGDPPMTQAQLYRIQRKAAGSIHVIEFGKGPERARDNFLKQLARENNGQYSYVDITKHLASP